MFTTAAQKELNQWNQSHLNNLGGGEEKKKKKDTIENKTRLQSRSTDC